MSATLEERWRRTFCEELDRVVELGAQKKKTKDPRRPSQKPPKGAWRIWLIRPGRGWGKNFSAAYQCCVWAEPPAPGVASTEVLALVSGTVSDVRKTMIEWPLSGILEVARRFFPDNIPTYYPSRRELVWPSGAVAHTYSSEKPGQLRGPQHTKAWADEIDAWSEDTSPKKARKTFDNLRFGLRLGDDPRMIVTSTPKTGRLVAMLMERAKKQADVAVTTGSTYENRENLADAFIADLEETYEGTRLGRQEIHGELLEDIEGAIIERAWIDDHRIHLHELPGEWVEVEGAKWYQPAFDRVVVAMDPVASSEEHSDEFGLIGAGSIGEHAYVWRDASFPKATPDQWARRSVGLLRELLADHLVAEKNNGGEMIEDVIRTRFPDVPVKLVWASRAKQKRAAPVALKYEQGRIHHVIDPERPRELEKAEDELCRFTTWGYDGNGSPNRGDAAVWALTDLLVSGINPAEFL